MKGKCSKHTDTHAQTHTHLNTMGGFIDMLISFTVIIFHLTLKRCVVFICQLSNEGGCIQKSSENISKLNSPAD